MTRKQKLIIAAVIMFLIMLACLWRMIPGLIRIISNCAVYLLARDGAGFGEYVHSFGWQGAVILFVVQAFQVFFPIFPEVILQLAAGATYGLWIGTLILMSSYTLCNYAIFWALRRYHINLPQFILASKPWKKCRRIMDNHSPQTVVFMLYLFPFLSNCFVPLVAAQTGIRFRDYAWIMILACLPMMMTCIYLGDRLMARDWLMASLAFFIGAGVSLVLYLGQRQIMEWFRRYSQARQAKAGATE